ncbi:protein DETOXIFICATION 29-like [Euphorbia lathyris]|uniref:protein DETOXIFICATION 29-like n=1 Tax=Euphorbia lathyris TaxID=212925 RepID=UPI003313FD99
MWTDCATYVNTSNSFSTFIVGADDIPTINDPGDFVLEFAKESKKLWFLAAPAIFTSICQYSLGAVTQTFAGQVGTLDLAAISVENLVIAGFSFGAMLGMGSALETLCGQALCAGKIDMLGVYLQRSWVILGTTTSFLCLLYVFATNILKAIGQTEAISSAVGLFALYMIPQLFAYTLNFPMSKFLQAQSKIMVMAVIAGSALILHVIFSWLFMLKLGWGMAGAAAVLNAAWWFIDICQFIYPNKLTADRKGRNIHGRLAELKSYLDFCDWLSESVDVSCYCWRGESACELAQFIAGCSQAIETSN